MNVCACVEMFCRHLDICTLLAAWWYIRTVLSIHRDHYDCQPSKFISFYIYLIDREKRARKKRAEQKFSVISLSLIKLLKQGKYV